jgi:hypothetical protein
MLGYGIDLEESKLEKPSDFHLLFYGSIDGYKCSNGVGKYRNSNSVVCLLFT